MDIFNLSRLWYINEAKLDENTIFTGCEDGWIRVVSLFPHNVKVFDHHADEIDDAFPVSKIGISNCGRILGSIGNDYCVKFFDISEIDDFIQNKTKDVIDNIVENAKTTTKKATEQAKNVEFFEDL